MKSPKRAEVRVFSLVLLIPTGARAQFALAGSGESLLAVIDARALPRAAALRVEAVKEGRWGRVGGRCGGQAARLRAGGLEHRTRLGERAGSPRGRVRGYRWSRSGVAPGERGRVNHWRSEQGAIGQSSYRKKYSKVAGFK